MLLAVLYTRSALDYSSYQFDSYEDVAPRVDYAVAAGRATEAPEHLGVDRPQPRTRQHRYRQLRHHGHVERYAVARLDSREVPEQVRKLVDPDVQVLVCDKGARSSSSSETQMNAALFFALAR